MKKQSRDQPDEAFEDVINKLLPRFSANEFSASDSAAYASALACIHSAFSAKITQEIKRRLIDELRATPFVLAIDAQSGKRKFLTPDLTYIPNDPLRSLFAGVPNVWFAHMKIGDHSYDERRALLCACGARDCLALRFTSDRIIPNDILEFRRLAGASFPTIDFHFEDYVLRDLDKILVFLPELTSKEAANRAMLLWEALCDFVNRGGTLWFFAEYYWCGKDHVNYAHFDPAFIKDLRQTPWVPMPDGTLGIPSEVIFEDINPNWTPNQFLLSRIPFKTRASGLRNRHHAGVVKRRDMATIPIIKNPNRISVILKDLEVAWHTTPNLRMDQLLAKAALKSCIVSYFEIGDTELLRCLMCFSGRHNQANGQVSEADLEAEESPQRMTLLLEALKTAWMLNPDFRMGQLLMEAGKLNNKGWFMHVLCREFYNTSDDALLQGIRCMIKNPI